MIVRPVQFDPTLITGPADDMDSPRSPGLHLSQIYHSIEAELCGSRSPMAVSLLQTYRSVGFIWERVMDRCFAEALAGENWFRPPEVELDGIIGSPDLISAELGMLGETKCTWGSSKHLADLENGTGKYWIWLVQIKGYLKMLRMLRCRLFALFVNGNYKNGYQPELAVRDLEFTQKEIDENWRMITDHARRKGWL